MHIRKLLAAAALGLAGLGAAHATTVSVAAGQWYDFNVDDFLAPVASPLAWIDFTNSSLLSFQFTVEAGSVGTLTVVDAVTAGERFSVIANGSSLGTTSVAGSSGANVGYDYDAALANLAFSRGVYTLGAGAYTVTGLMLPSADGINATQGGLRLDVSPVPEASTLALLLGGLGALAFVARRRAA